MLNDILNLVGDHLGLNTMQKLVVVLNIVSV